MLVYLGLSVLFFIFIFIEFTKFFFLFFFFSLDEFHPYLFEQYKDKKYIEYKTFDIAVDRFFSKIEAQKAEEQREEKANKIRNNEMFMN